MNTTQVLRIYCNLLLPYFLCFNVVKFSSVQLFETPYSSSLQEMNIIVPKGPRVGEEGGNKTRTYVRF
jgi:hypothetical protein